MSDYKVTDTQLGSIADAIRTKGDTSAQLEFPTGFVSAIEAIPSGGGSNVLIEPVYAGLSYGKMSGSDFVGDSSKIYCIYLFQVTGINSFFVLKNDSSGNRFFVNYFSGKTLQDFISGIETAQTGTIVSGTQMIVVSNNSVISTARGSTNMNGIVGVMTSNESVLAKCYCVNGDLLV